ncbi:MAG: hypothetical protein LBH19_13995 [Dysgonamonadaceae bacterium]|jgi:hypothetical protein|nr:hypothetical protein [Dysgonamonadaceae bacterium]
MKKLLGILMALAAVVGVNAQERDFEEYRKQASERFDSFKAKKQQEFEDFRTKANAEFAELMRKKWEAYRAIAGIPAPPSPDPVKPPVADPKTPPTADPVPFKEIEPIPEPVTPPQPIVPIPEPSQPGKQTFVFSFYHTECKVSLAPGQKIFLPDLSEKSIAEAWVQLTDPQYNSLINDCLQLRSRMDLCDWAYIQLLQTLTEKYYQSTVSNEAVLLQMYILTQSGYKVRIAKSGNRLALLIPSNQTIYSYTYFNLSGENYYVIDKSLQETTFNIFDRAFPQEQTLSLHSRPPHFAQANTAVKAFSSAVYPEIKVSVSTNKNLMDFYNTYPVHSGWELYAAASMSESLKSELYPALRNAIAGKSEAEAANRLINFVQTAFAYQTDDKQFGYERPLFADEIFYYPYSDCEDRSILFSVLVRELLNLEVVLLHYPNHLATAVHFNDNSVSGDYLMINGKKFIVCDPTYINASIGNAMPKFKNVSAEVVRFP